MELNDKYNNADNPEIVDRINRGVFTDKDLLILSIKNLSDNDKALVDLGKLINLDSKNLESILASVKDKDSFGLDKYNLWLKVIAIKNKTEELKAGSESIIKSAAELITNSDKNLQKSQKILEDSLYNK